MFKQWFKKLFGRKEVAQATSVVPGSYWISSSKPKTPAFIEEMQKEFELQRLREEFRIWKENNARLWSRQEQRPALRLVS